MDILRKLFNFEIPIDDLIIIYIAHIRSHLEQSCVIWHASISEESSNAFERVQKIALRLILKQGYISYQNALEITGFILLSERREDLCLQFAKSCVKNDKAKSMFPINDDNFYMNNRPNIHREKYKVLLATSKRLKKSAIPFMQELLNKEHFNLSN